MEELYSITDISAYKIIEEIHKGYSGDRKYKLYKDGKYFLLRVGGICRYPEIKGEYERLKKFDGSGIRLNTPVLLGIAGNRFYSVVTWVEGTPVMDIIKENISGDHYDIGRRAGEALRRLHSFGECVPGADWRKVIEKRADKFLSGFHKMNIGFKGSELAEEYIIKNIGLADDRPQVILHGDFHWENCVVDGEGNVGIIDFSGRETGDPWYDLTGVLWAAEYSGSFARGEIEGYFGDIPGDFWGIFKLYAGLYMFEHFMFSDGSAEDIGRRIKNGGRMAGLWGEGFERDMPLFLSNFNILTCREGHNGKGKFKE